MTSRIYGPQPKVARGASPNLSATLPMPYIQQFARSVSTEQFYRQSHPVITGPTCDFGARFEYAGHPCVRYILRTAVDMLFFSQLFALSKRLLEMTQVGICRNCSGDRASAVGVRLDLFSQAAIPVDRT